MVLGAQVLYFSGNKSNEYIIPPIFGPYRDLRRLFLEASSQMRFLDQFLLMCGSSPNLERWYSCPLPWMCLTNHSAADGICAVPLSSDECSSHSGTLLTWGTLKGDCDSIRCIYSLMHIFVGCSLTGRWPDGQQRTREEDPSKILGMGDKLHARILDQAWAILMMQSINWQVIKADTEFKRIFFFFFLFQSPFEVPTSFKQLLSRDFLHFLFQVPTW